MELEQASGIISWWDDVLQQGVVRQNRERAFFLYKSKIVSGVPRKGLRVHLEYNPSQQLKPGYLPKAYNAVVEDYSTGAAVLAQGLPEVSGE
jgi:hypothetical protein